jgi:serine/threonine-protein kinase
MTVGDDRISGVPSDNHEQDETVGASAVTPSLSAPRIGRDLPLAASFSPGEVLAGRFQIARFIAAGGMGEVYEADDRELGGRVALKTIRSGIAEEAGSIDRFKREVHLARQVTHANVCRIYDVFRHEGTTFLTMELLHGETLADRLSRSGRLSTAQALPIVSQIAAGLAAAHRVGVIHRDFKSANVMLVPDAGEESGVRAVVTDFGLARRSVAQDGESLSATMTAGIAGTPAYMAPEQVEGGTVTAAADIYALGVVMYEMVTGERPFTGHTPLSIAVKRLKEAPSSPRERVRDLDPAWERAILRCLERDPSDRFASAGDVVRAVGGERIAGGRPRRARRRIAWAAIALGLLTAAAVGYRWIRFRAPTGAIDSLAILPFENPGKEPNADYLGDGLAESLIDRMSRVPSLKVMARATVFRFKGAADPQEAGRKLGVGAVLTGSVSRRGNDLSISAELVETATGARLWGGAYDRPLADLLSVQDAIASAVSDGLRLRLSDDEKRALALHGTTNPEAYELALKARYFFQKETEEGNLEARRLYEQAAQKDPKFVEAWLGIAATHASTAVNGYGPPGEAWSQQAGALGKARGLEPGNVLVRAALAHRRFYFDWDWSYCEGEYRELATEPRVLRSEMFRPIGLYLWARGRPDDALALMDRSLRIDPGNVATRMMRADFLAHAGKLEDAIAEYKAIVETETSNPAPFYGLAELLRRRADVHGAIETLRKAYELSGEETGAKALGTARREEDYENAEVAVARSRLADLEALAGERYVSPLDLARLQAQVGEREKAFASLAAALAERSPALVFLKVDRAWDRIRDDPLFASLIRRVGIP